MDVVHGDGRFPTTHWSLVGRAGQDALESKRQALGELLSRYLSALQAHLVYGKRLKPEDADDLLQEFVATKILEKQLIGRADAECGKFRTFLLTALDRFLIDRHREARAGKRSPGKDRLQTLDDGAEPIQADGPPDSFDLAWARNVIDQTVQMMRAQCDAASRSDVWGVFECRLLDPLLRDVEPVDYDELVRRYGLQSPSQASNLLMTAKRTFARVLHTVVGEYARSDDEIEAEIRELMEILARARR
jgi:DNA-directed RNA polymerase specialized sigma24 family protein